MAVITASSLFLIVLSVGTVQDGERAVNVGELIDDLQQQGLWPHNDRSLELNVLEHSYCSLSLPEGASGLCLIYRVMGNQTPLLCLGVAPPEDAIASSDRAPTLIIVDERAVPGMVEMMVW